MVPEGRERCPNKNQFLGTSLVMKFKGVAFDSFNIDSCRGTCKNVALTSGGSRALIVGKRRDAQWVKVTGWKGTEC